MLSFPLLITTAIDPPQGLRHLRMTQRASRLIATKTSIFFWATMQVKKMVIADATGAEVLSREDVAHLADMGCEVEQISYLQDKTEILEKGKGYGEGRLIEFALRSSGHLAASRSFYKCTGKVFCRNASIIDEQVQGNRLNSVFWVGSYTGTRFDHVDLRFFLSERDLFLSSVLPGYLAATREDDYVEKLVTPGISRRLGTGKMRRPRLTGFSGGSNALYADMYLGDMEAQFPCYLGQDKAAKS